MSVPLRVLILEDSDDDALLLTRELKRHQPGIVLRRADSAITMNQALDEAEYDIILSDYSMAGFSAPMVLKIVQERSLDVPVIIVSGTVGEDTAVAAMKAGAADFFAKDKIQRLIPAIEREVRDAQSRYKRRQAEKELLLKTRAVEASPAGVVITDPTLPDNPIVYVNPSFEEMTGYTPEEVYGKNCRFLQGTDQDQAGIHEIRDALREQREANVTLRNYRKDGTMFWNQLRIAPILDGDGALIHYVGILSDITPQKTSEEELRALYSATSILFQSNNLSDLGRGIANTVVREFKYADCGIMLIDERKQRLIRLPRSGEYGIQPSVELSIDGPGLVPMAIRTGEVTYASDVTRHAGYTVGSPETRSELVVPLRTADRVIGVMDLQSTQPDAFSERDRRILLAYAEHAAASLEIVKLVEEVNRHAAELEWRVARRTAELQSSKDQVEAILNNVGDVIVVLDSRGRVMQVNPAFEQVFGYSDETFVMQEFADRRLFATPEHLISLIDQVAVSNEASRSEFKCLNRAGHEIDVDVVLAPVPGDSVDDRLIVCSIRDISAQKRLETGLRQALTRANELVELKARFVSILSHEFRTPLAVILTAAQLVSMYSDRLDEASKKEKMENIQGQVKHLTQLTDGMLMLGQAETVGLSYQPHSVDVVGFCAGVIDDLQSIARKRHTIDFVQVGCPDVLPADDKLLGHILRNLVSNAIKYSPQGGMINVNLLCDGDELVLTVKDNGIGIPLAAQESLFEMFHRAENVGAIAGTGLGLSIVKHAVDTYNGKITFTSAENQGTTFTVTLPIAANPEGEPYLEN